MRIHIWCPGVSATGGIEAYSLHLIRAVREILPNAKITVAVRNERTKTLHEQLPDRVTGIGTPETASGIRSAIFGFVAFLHALIDRPDLILLTHLNFGPVARWLKQLQKTPYWISLHGIEAWRIDRKPGVRALIDADLLLPVSNYTRERVAAEQGISSSKFEILPDTFDSERFNIGPKSLELLQRYNLTENNRVILTVGRLSQFERYKGHDRIVRALPIVRAAIPDVRYLIVGDGNDRGRLEGLTGELGVSDSVIFCGAVRGDELADHYRLCDVFAMPSTGEGFGIVFLEALGSGKPVISGNMDASPDPLLDGELGILIDPNDGNALASQLIEVLSRRSSHPFVYRPEELRRRAIQHFGPQAFRSRLEQILRDHIGVILE